METVRLILLFAHILGFAALLGGTLAQVKQPAGVTGGGVQGDRVDEPAAAQGRRINGPMRDGAGTAVLAGIALVGVIEAGGGSLDHVKIAVKLVVGVVILGLVMANLRKPRISDGLFFTILGLTVLNIAVAVFWAPAHHF